MRMNKTLSFEHQAKKKETEEKDTTDKFKVIMMIYKKFKLFGLTGEKIPIPETKRYRLPDIVIPQRNIVIELDGEIHEGWDDLTTLEKDKDRNQDYKEAGYQIIVINKELTFGYKEEHIIKKLEQEGLKQIE